MGDSLIFILRDGFQITSGQWPLGSDLDKERAHLYLSPYAKSSLAIRSTFRICQTVGLRIPDLLSESGDLIAAGTRST